MHWPPGPRACATLCKVPGARFGHARGSSMSKMRAASLCDASIIARATGCKVSGSLGQRPSMAPARAVICRLSFWSAVPVDGLI